MATVKKPVKKTSGKPSGKKPSGKGKKKNVSQNPSNSFMDDFKEKHAEAYAIGAWLMPIFGGILLGIIFSKFGGFVTGPSTRQIMEQNSQHIEYRNEVESLTNQYHELQQDTTKYSKEKYYSGGPEVESVARIADGSFFNKYLTWSSNDEYLQKKQSLEGYGYRDGSTFHDAVFAEDSVNYTCECLGGDYYKLRVDGMNSYYAGEICVKITPEEGTPVWRYLYVTFTINGQNISNVQAAVLDKEKTGNIE